MIPALVLTAGLATRLRPLSFVRAKAALPVAGEPLVLRILRCPSRQRRHRRRTQPASPAAHAHQPRWRRQRRRDTRALLVGDAGARVRGGPEARPLVAGRSGFRAAGSTFLIVNGDTLTDADVGEVIADHQRSGALVTMAVIPNTEPDKYGGSGRRRRGGGHWLRPPRGGAVVLSLHRRAGGGEPRRLPVCPTTRRTNRWARFTRR